ncbi:Alg9-like mannosyltransferase family-domain-containing protein [Sporodiniella umbellata]|nr:Alg9-like mannosyltransferase family-domain-containing protein [Sporodiniella umbellata]
MTLFDQQILVRIVLASSVVISLGQFAQAVRTMFGKRTAIATIMLLLCQFHFVFWSSRTLPNTLALPWVLIGMSHWLKSIAQTSKRTHHLEYMCRYLTFAGIVFRFEVGILLAILAITEWVYNRYCLLGVLKTILFTAVISLLITVPIDSVFWDRWLWPEGLVFYFNAILNKSSEWGTLPLHAYFVSFLPRLLLVSYPLSIAAFLRNTQARRILLPMVVYVAIFSLLPHKEWRFIVYTIPLFTTTAATQINELLTHWRRSLISRLMLLAVIGGALVSFLASLAMLKISSLNYPGGHSLRSLHNIEKNTPFVSVHMDVETAMTGASLFGQINPNWKYSKNEKHVIEDDFINAGYTHILTAHPERFNSFLFELIHTTYGIESIRLVLPNKTYKNQEPKIEIVNLFGLARLQTILTPKIYLLRVVHPQVA